MNFLNSINAILYYPILIILLIASGLYFTFKTGLIQLSLLKNAFSVITETPKKGEVSSFQALMVSTASRVGTGNIVGVSNAICIGGYGAIFWMWIIAIIGSSSAFIESTLAQIYKKKGKNGSYGGPSYYIQNGIGSKTLGLIFAISLILTYAVGFNMLASFNLQDSFRVYTFYNPKTTPWLIGLFLSIIAGFCILGGGKRIIKVTSILVPLMGLVFILVSLIIIFKNYTLFPSVMKRIFLDAFNFRAIFGGISSSCLVEGIKRGLYSNEAGMGSSPNAAASSMTTHPVKQGLVQMISVFIDTLVICSATAFICLSSGIEPQANIAGAKYVQMSLATIFGFYGHIFITFSLALFAFTTLLGNLYYVDSCIAYCLKKDPSKNFQIAYRILASIFIFLGCGMKMDFAWNLSDFLMGIMCLINIPTILYLSNTAFRALDDYKSQLKKGLDPIFIAKNIGLDDTKLDYWK